MKIKKKFFFLWFGFLKIKSIQKNKMSLMCWVIGLGLLLLLVAIVLLLAFNCPPANENNQDGLELLSLPSSSSSSSSG